MPDPRAALPLGLLPRLHGITSELIAPALLVVVLGLGCAGTGRLLSGIGRPERDLRWGRGRRGCCSGGRSTTLRFASTSGMSALGWGLGPRTRGASGGAIDPAGGEGTSVGASGPTEPTGAPLAGSMAPWATAGETGHYLPNPQHETHPGVSARTQNTELRLHPGGASGWGPALGRWLKAYA